MNKEFVQTKCRDMVAQLMEHCDSARIFITSHDGKTEETLSFNTGNGNFAAQYGQVKEWIIMQEQYARTQADRDQREDLV